MNRPPAIRIDRGFTLVELLVIIVLIAALSALAFQGLSAARTQADKAVSAGNLRQLAAANLLYAADHLTYCPADLNGRNLTLWHGARPSISTPFDPEKGLLSEYLGQSRQIGKCPQLEHMINASAFNERNGGGYGYNDVYIGGNNNYDSQGNAIPNRPANVTSPQRTLMFATTALAVSGGIQEYPFAEPFREVDSNGRLGASYQPSIHFRFNGRALIAWCDGHVSEELPTGKAETNFYGGSNKTSKIAFCGPAENNGWWNPKN